MSKSIDPPAEPEREKRRVEHPEAIPSDSVFFEKVVPALLLVLAVLTGAFVLVAAGILLGLIPWF